MSRASVMRRVNLVIGLALLFWAGLALAALEVIAEAVPPSLAGGWWIHVGIAALISSGSGMCATFGRELRAKYDDKPFESRAEYRRDVAVGAVLGLAGYAAGWMLHLSTAQLALGLVVIGFGGTKILTAAVGRVVKMIKDETP